MPAAFYRTSDEGDCMWRRFPVKGLRKNDRSDEQPSGRIAPGRKVGNAGHVKRRCPHRGPAVYGSAQPYSWFRATACQKN